MTKTVRAHYTQEFKQDAARLVSGGQANPAALVKTGSPATASAKKAPAKKAAAKKVPAKNAATTRAAAAVPAAENAPATKVVTLSPDSADTIKKLTDSLRKMGDKRPTKPASLWRSLKSFLGTVATEESVEVASVSFRRVQAAEFVAVAHRHPVHGGQGGMHGEVGLLDQVVTCGSPAHTR